MPQTEMGKCPHVFLGRKVVPFSHFGREGEEFFPGGGAEDREKVVALDVGYIAALKEFQRFFFPPFLVAKWEGRPKN